MTFRACIVATAFIAPSLALHAEASAADRDNPAIALPNEALVLPSMGRYGRTPIPVDVVQLALCSGSWKAPKAEDTLTDPDGKERKWFAVTFKDGTVNHSSLRGGYAFFSVHAVEQRVMILEAAGHALVLV